LAKFTFFSFIFHVTLLLLFKLDLINLQNNKEQFINVGISEEKPKDVIKKEKPNKVIKKEKPKEVIKKEKPKEVIKKEKPNKVIKKEKAKKAIKKEKPKKNKEEKFDDLLKNLAEEELPLSKNNNFEKTLKDLSKENLFEKESLKTNKTELNEIQKVLLSQVNRNWSRPPGIKVSKDLVIKIIITLDSRGKVVNLKVHQKTQNEILKNNSLQPFLDSALRAIKKSSPFEGLKKDRYNIWKNIIINFKPIEAS